MKVSFKGVTVQESVLFWDYKAEANTAEYIFRPTDDQAEIVKSLAPISGIRIEEKRACIDNVKHFVTDHPFLQPRHSTSLTTEEPNKNPGTDKPSSSFFKRRMKPWPSARLSDKELRSLKNTSGSLSQEEDSRHSVHLIPITPQTSPSLNPLEFPDTLASGQLFQPYGKLDLDTIIPEKTAPEDWRKTVVYRKALNDANKEHIQKSEIQLLKDAQDITKEVYQIAGPTLFDLKGQVISILESCLAILENALKEIDHVKYPFPNSIYPFFRSLIVQAMVNTEDNFKSYESVTSARDEKYIKQQIAKLKLVRPRLLSFHYFEDPDLTKITDDFQLQAYLDQLKSKLSLRQRLELRVLLAGLEQIILESIRYELQFKKKFPASKVNLKTFQNHFNLSF